MLDPDRRATKCVLHIGLEKTGTSSIQRFLADNRDLLREEGVLYPRVGGGEGSGSNWGFAALACDTPWDTDIGGFLDLRSQSDVDAYRTSVVQGLALDFSRSDPPRLMIVSSEHFHSRLRTDREIDALKSFLELWAESFQVVLYLRRQDRVARSLCSTHVKSGQTDPSPFLPKAGDTLPYYYDYERIYSNWAAVFGKEAVSVRLFEESGSTDRLVADFAAVCGLSLSGKSIPPVINASIDAKATEFLVEVNKQLQNRDRALARWVGRHLSRRRKGKAFLFSRKDARHFYEQFIESNERLKELVFGDREAPLFDDSFEEYPEVLAPPDRTYEDAVAIALQLIDEIFPGRPPLFTSYPEQTGAVALIRWLRRDLRSQFPIDDRSGWRSFLNWLVVNGLREYRLLGEDRAFQSYLQGVEPGDCVSRLMRLVHSYRGGVGLDLALPGHRVQFENWFYSYAVEEFRLWPLLTREEERRLPRTPRRDEAESLSFAERPFGVNLIGHAYGQLGIGEDVRMAGRALEATGVPFCILDFPPGSGVPQDDFSMIEHVTEEGPYAFNVFCLTAQEHARYVAERGTKQLTGRFNIGYWPWELGKWPEGGEQVASFVDEAWVSSRHTYASLAPVCPVSLRRMPMAVELVSVSSKSRSDFGLPSGALLFCFSFDLNSSLQRKNPQACIEAFRLAFPKAKEGETSASNVGLVIKANRTGRFELEWEKLKQAAGEDPRIHVVEENFEKCDVLALYKCCDCFLSLHRAEGFGRGIAEALQLGLHVITTGYSGNVDFCEGPRVDLVDYKLIDLEDGQYPFGAGQVWAEPDVGHAASLMVKLAGRGGDSGRQAGGDPGDWPQFGAAAVGGRYRERLQAIRDQDGASPDQP